MLPSLLVPEANQHRKMQPGDGSSFLTFLRNRNSDLTSVLQLKRLHFDYLAVDEWNGFSAPSFGLAGIGPL